MVVYVELAFLQNFFLDGLLLWLACKAARVSASRKRLLFSALLGGAFALLFPLLYLPELLSEMLKVAVGCLLVLVVFGRIKTKNEWGRYAFTCVCFFGLTFLFAGAISGIWGENASPVYAILGFVLLTPVAIVLIRTFYKKRTAEKYVYDCEIVCGKRRASVSAFLDSGNLAQKNGLPVCFLSPEIAFDIFGELMLGEGGQVGDEIAIATMAGEKTLPVYKGKLKICGREKEVYFAASANMLSRGYKLLLNSRVLEEETEK